MRAHLNADAAIDAGASVDIHQTIGSALKRGTFKPGCAIAAGDADAGGRHADGAPGTLRFTNAAGGALAGVNLVAAPDLCDGARGADMDADVAVRADPAVEAAFPGFGAGCLGAQAEIDFIKVPD